MEQQEECHTVQVKVHHHEKPKYQKWKRSSEEEAIEDGDVEVGVAEGEIVTTGGVTKVEGGEMAADGSIRKERSLHLLTGLAGAVAGSHVGKKLGLGVGLAIGLGSKKLALKKKEKVVHHKSHPKAVHHKVKHETVCNHVPVKRCTSTKQCEKVPWQKCEKLPVKNCKQVPNTKCWTTPHEVCTTVTDTQCKQVPHETCHQVPKQRCVSIPNQVCVNVPEQKCWKEPSEKCWDEPVQKCHQVPEEKCWQVDKLFLFFIFHDLISNSWDRNLTRNAGMNQGNIATILL